MFERRTLFVANPGYPLQCLYAGVVLDRVFGEGMELRPGYHFATGEIAFQRIQELQVSLDDASDIVVEGLDPFVEFRPMASINDVFQDLHAGKISRRVILTPEG